MVNGCYPAYRARQIATDTQENNASGVQQGHLNKQHAPAPQSPGAASAREPSEICLPADCVLLSSASSMFNQLLKL